VRVVVTYIAAIYIFLGSAVLIAIPFYVPENSEAVNNAKDIFLAVLPVGTGIVTYWFANRSTNNMVDQQDGGKNSENTKDTPPNN